MITVAVVGSWSHHKVNVGEDLVERSSDLPYIRSGLAVWKSQERGLLGNTESLHSAATLAFS